MKRRRNAPPKVKTTHLWFTWKKRRPADLAVAIVAGEAIYSSWVFATLMPGTASTDSEFLKGQGIRYDIHHVDPIERVSIAERASHAIEALVLRDYPFSIAGQSE